MSDGDRRPHILCVNDTQEILDLLQELLEQEGYRVTISMSLLNIDKIKALKPDVIVQDLLFPQSQEEGWKFLTLVRLDPDLRRVPLILCTAATQVVNDEKMAEHLDQLGVRVILKPFDIEELLDALRDVLAAQALLSRPES